MGGARRTSDESRSSSDSEDGSSGGGGRSFSVTSCDTGLKMKIAAVPRRARRSTSSSRTCSKCSSSSSSDELPLRAVRERRRRRVAPRRSSSSSSSSDSASDDETAAVGPAEPDSPPPVPTPPPAPPPPPPPKADPPPSDNSPATTTAAGVEAAAMADEGESSSEMELPGQLVVAAIQRAAADSSDSEPVRAADQRDTQLYANTLLQQFVRQTQLLSTGAPPPPHAYRAPPPPPAPRRRGRPRKRLSPATVSPDSGILSSHNSPPPAERKLDVAALDRMLYATDRVLYPPRPRREPLAHVYAKRRSVLAALAAGRAAAAQDPAWRQIDLRRKYKDVVCGASQGKPYRACSRLMESGYKSDAGCRSASGYRTDRSDRSGYRSEHERKRRRSRRARDRDSIRNRSRFVSDLDMQLASDTLSCLTLAGESVPSPPAPPSTPRPPARVETGSQTVNPRSDPFAPAPVFAIKSHASDDEAPPPPKPTPPPPLTPSRVAFTHKFGCAPLPVRRPLTTHVLQQLSANISPPHARALKPMKVVFEKAQNSYVPIARNAFSHQTKRSRHRSRHRKPTVLAPPKIKLDSDPTPASRDSRPRHRHRSRSRSRSRARSASAAPADLARFTSDMEALLAAFVRCCLLAEHEEPAPNPPAKSVEPRQAKRASKKRKTVDGESTSTKRRHKKQAALETGDTPPAANEHKLPLKKRHYHVDEVVPPAEPGHQAALTDTDKEQKDEAPVSRVRETPPPVATPKKRLRPSTPPLASAPPPAPSADLVARKKSRLEGLAHTLAARVGGAGRASPLVTPEAPPAGVFEPSVDLELHIPKSSISAQGGHITVESEPTAADEAPRTPSPAPERTTRTRRAGSIASVLSDRLSEAKRRKPAEKTSEKKTDKSIDKSVDKSVEKSVDKSSVKAADKTIRAKSADNSVVKSVEKIVKSIDKSVDKSTDKSVEKQVVKSIDKPATKASEKPTVKTVDKATYKAADKRQAKDAETPTEPPKKPRRRKAINRTGFPSVKKKKKKPAESAATRDCERVPRTGEAAASFVQRTARLSVISLERLRAPASQDSETEEDSIPLSRLNARTRRVTRSVPPSPPPVLASKDAPPSPVPTSPVPTNSVLTVLSPTAPLSLVSLPSDASPPAPVPPTSSPSDDASDCEPLPPRERRPQQRETPPKRPQRPRKIYLRAGLFSDYYKRDQKSSTSPKTDSEPKTPLLPRPTHCERWVRRRQQHFALPYDIWWRQRRSQLHPSWTYRKIRTNLYAEARPPAEECEAVACNCTPDSGCPEDCINRLVYAECSPQLCPCGERCRNQRIQRHEWTPRLERFMTKGKGWGVRTGGRIPCGDFILEYVGEVVSEREFKHRMETRYARDQHHYCLHLDGGLVIDGHRAGGEGRFVNHSCRPNCEMQKWTANGTFRMALFALRDIAPGEELTYDYNFSLFNPAEGQACRCGWDECRGVIGGKSQRVPRRALPSTAAAPPTTPSRVGRPRKPTKCKQVAPNAEVAEYKSPTEPTPPPPALSARERALVRRAHCFLLRSLRQRRTRVTLPTPPPASATPPVAAPVAPPPPPLPPNPAVCLTRLPLPDTPTEAAPRKSGEDVIDCICGLHMEEGLMVQCGRAGCGVWQHARCMRVTDTQAPHRCHTCQPRPIDREITLDEYTDEGHQYYLSLMRGDLQVRQGDAVYVLRDIPIDEKRPDASGETPPSGRKRQARRKDEGVRKHTYRTIGDIAVSELDIFRVERLWRHRDTGERFVYGHHYLRPHETYHEPTRKFFSNEVVRVPLYEAVPIDLVMSRCWVLDLNTYCKGRPVGAREQHVYVCELRVDRSARLFSKVARHKYPVCTAPFAFTRFPQRLKVTRTYAPHEVAPEYLKGRGRVARRPDPPTPPPPPSAPQARTREQRKERLSTVIARLAACAAGVVAAAARGVAPAAGGVASVAAGNGGATGMGRRRKPPA